MDVMGLGIEAGVGLCDGSLAGRCNLVVRGRALRAYILMFSVSSVALLESLHPACKTAAPLEEWQPDRGFSVRTENPALVPQLLTLTALIILQNQTDQKRAAMSLSVNDHEYKSCLKMINNDPGKKDIR